MIIIADTSPLIGLAKIGHLRLLGELATATYIPPQVQRELLAKVGSEAKAIEEALAGLIHVRSPNPEDAAEQATLRALDEGERQTIRLARSFSESNLLLMDDKTGRSAARRLGQKVIGLPGLLLLAKRRGVLPTVAPFLEELRLNGYWLSDRLVELVRQLAAE